MRTLAELQPELCGANCTCKTTRNMKKQGRVFPFKVNNFGKYYIQTSIREKKANKLV
jgi:hypothetical protein